jgi:hypothetical protein
MRDMMNLHPIKRHRAERYVLVSLITFAVTVIALRTILWAAGYPQMGDGAVHIAHVVWGGLGLFAGSIVLLVLTNRWALLLGAVLGGGGVGLFIDEVGKFVTRSNNYFSPVAAPIIYGLFLLTLLVYLHVRRPSSQDTRAEMHRAFEQMGGVLDGATASAELDALAHRLRLIQDSGEDDTITALAASMLAFVATQQTGELRQPLARWHGLVARVKRFGRQAITPGRLRMLLVPALAGCGLFGILNIAIPGLESAGSVPRPPAFTAGLALQGGVGLAALAGAILLASGRHKTGMGFAFGSLAVGLTFCNLLVLYQDQDRGLFLALVQWVALAIALSYRRICQESREQACYHEYASGSTGPPAVGKAFGARARARIGDDVTTFLAN